MVSSNTPRYLSPLRYPGGKAALAAFIARLIRNAPKTITRYVEPFAGGSGVGLRLLFDECVDTIVLNDIDPGVAAFWRATFTRTDELTARIRACQPSITEWRRQRAIFDRAGSQDDVELGFATLYLNRTNRSGILRARPIGGLEQGGAWRLDARFNPAVLASRIRLLARYAARVTILERDGVDVARTSVRDPHSFVYIDPPYIGAGSGLYLDVMTWADHVRLARAIRDHGNWLVTYDADARVRTELFVGFRCATFALKHTAAKAHIGREWAVFSSALRVPSLVRLGRAARVIPVTSHAAWGLGSSR